MFRGELTSIKVLEVLHKEMSLNCVLFLVHVQISQYLANFSRILLFSCVCEKDNIAFGNLQLKGKSNVLAPRDRERKEVTAQLFSEEELFCGGPDEPSTFSHKSC